MEAGRPFIRIRAGAFVGACFLFGVWREREMKAMSILQNDEFLLKNMMGPNAVTMVDELTRDLPLGGAKRILDLGCGTGLTSIRLAERFPACIFALDLWIPAAENYERLRALGLDERIIPLHGDATDPPFADGYFDAVVSVDAYHYFGRDPDYLDTHLAPLVKPGGLLALAFPGTKWDLETLPPEMALSWTAEDIATLPSLAWWTRLFSQAKRAKLLSITEMACFDEAWRDWLKSDNPYAVHDRPAMEAGAGKYMNLIAAVLERV